MRKPIAIATVALIAGAASGAEALSNISLGGSGSLATLTSDAIASCAGAAGLTSLPGEGQSALLVASGQTVAPMSYFLNAGACGGAALTDGGRSALSTAEGLVIGLDGISLLGSTTTSASAACNSNDAGVDASASCDPAFQPNSGAAYNTTISTTSGSYTFNGWRDVLRVLLAGFDHTNVGVGASNWAKRDCNSAVRKALANTYGNFFENQCTAPAGDSTNGVCTEIRHVFRPDDFSGTAQMLTLLLELPSIVNPGATGTLVAGAPTVTASNTGATPFCNAVRPAFVFPTGSTPMCLQGSDATWDPTSLCPNGQSNCATASVTVAGCTEERAVYVSTMQDNDPIRRTCAGTGRGGQQEDVCSHSGDLGLVLPMNDVPEPNFPHLNSGNSSFEPSASNVDRYNATACVVGKVSAGPAPELYDAVTQLKVTARVVTGIALCPGGDITNTLGACTEPATGATPPSGACLALKPTIPGTPISNQAVPVAHAVTPALGDGREFNQHLFSNNAGSAVYQTDGFVENPSTNVSVTGAYYRIHAGHTLAPASANPQPPPCQQPDMALQIACLVQASPCSLGVASRTGLAWAQSTGVGTDAIKVGGLPPSNACIQAIQTTQVTHYPLWHKLYMNTLVGFANVTGQEAALVECEDNVGILFLGQSFLNPLLALHGLVDLPASVNGGAPYCEDFNEKMLCGQAQNINGCASNASLSITTVTTTCGDGNLDALEECDNGTNNGPPPATCSTACRNQ